MEVSTSLVGNSSEPDIFGPPFWFVLHNGIHSYPRNPTPYVKEGMRQLIINLPLLVPCQTCKEHFYGYIRTVNLDAVVATKETLFAFFVNVHNYVNKRYGKSEMSLQEAKQLYGYDTLKGPIMRITYK